VVPSMGLMIVDRVVIVGHGDTPDERSSHCTTHLFEPRLELVPLEWNL